MSLIPFRTKRASGMEPGSLATLADFRHEMNRLFEGFFSRPLATAGWFDTLEPGQWLPAIDMTENDKQIHVRAELPGIDPKDVDVSVSEDRLVISGEKKSQTEESGEGFDASQIAAEYRQGVLTIRVPRLAAVRPRTIEVRTA